MVFNSIVFALFLPFVFLVYWRMKTVPRRNAWLVLSGFFFYGWWDWRFLLLLAATALLDFYVAGRIAKCDTRKKKQHWLWLSLGGNLTVLGFFKYFNFFAASFNDLLAGVGLEADFVTLEIVLPVGISFYTFQALSYTLDVYYGKTPPEKNLVTYLAFISFFPQLVAGPVERASHMLPQFRAEKTFGYGFAVTGLRLMLWGLFKKVVIADNLAPLSDAVFRHPGDYSGVAALAGVLAFTLQVYCDFSGYSDIARGCGRLFGFDLMENFRFPYFASTLREFWQRWHISLSAWFRDYLYIPLGGNRRGKPRETVNLFLTFIVSGLWHGANWTFAAWGAIHGTGLIAERLYRGAGLPRFPKAVSYLLTLFFVTIAWIFFRAATFRDAWTILVHLFTGNTPLREVTEKAWGHSHLPWAVLFLVCGFLLADYLLYRRLLQRVLFPNKVARISIYYSVILLILLFGVFRNAPAFIYFQF